jgi:hypothetical protein
MAHSLYQSGRSGLSFSGHGLVYQYVLSKRMDGVKQALQVWLNVHIVNASTTSQRQSNSLSGYKLRTQVTPTSSCARDQGKTLALCGGLPAHLSSLVRQYVGVRMREIQSSYPTRFSFQSSGARFGGICRTLGVAMSEENLMVVKRAWLAVCPWFTRKSVFVSVFIFTYIGIHLALFQGGTGEMFLSKDAVDYIGAARRIDAGQAWSLGNRLPGYPLALALILRSGFDFRAAVVAVQLIALVATALATRRLQNMWIGSGGDVAGLIVMLNPVAVLTIHACDTHSLFTLALTAHLLFLTLALDRDDQQWFVWAGLALGVALTFRVAWYLLILVPIEVWLSARCLGQYVAFKRILRRIALTAMVALLPTIALIAADRLSDGKVIDYAPVTASYSQNYLTSQAISFNLWENARVLQQGTSVPHSENPQTTSVELRGGKVTDDSRNALEALRAASIGDLAIAEVKALIRFTFSAAARSLAVELRLPAKPFDVVQSEQGSFVLVLLAYFLQSRTFFVVVALMTGVVVVVRLLGLVGVLRLLRCSRWPLVAMAAVYFLAFALPPGFFANATYRLPVEPLLAILASASMVRSLSRPMASRK